MLKRFVKYIYRKMLFKLLRKSKNSLLRKQFNNSGVSIIASNCIAGCVYSDLEHPFNSPTINCFFYSSSFVQFCEHLEHYLNVELEEVSISKDAGQVGYPVGRLDDVEIHFLHYKNFSDAKQKWDQRRKRVNFNNMVFIMTDRDVNDPSDLKKFLSDNNNKRLIFTAKNEENNDNYIYCYKEKGSVVSPDFTTFRKYEHYINIVEWLNNAKRK